MAEEKARLEIMAQKVCDNALVEAPRRRPPPPPPPPRTCSNRPSFLHRCHITAASVDECKEARPQETSSWHHQEGLRTLDRGSKTWIVHLSSVLYIVFVLSMHSPDPLATINSTSQSNLSKLHANGLGSRSIEVHLNARRGCVSASASRSWLVRWPVNQHQHSGPCLAAVGSCDFAAAAATKRKGGRSNSRYRQRTSSHASSPMPSLKVHCRGLSIILQQRWTHVDVYMSRQSVTTSDTL